MKTVVTGLGWMGGQTGSIQTALQDMVSGAQRKLVILAYSISDGALGFLGAVRSRLRDGLEVTLIVNKPESQHGGIPQLLSEMVATYPSGLLLYQYVDPEGGELHAKAVICDDRVAFIGSANLSWSGLVKNSELGVILQGADVEDLSLTVNKLITSSYVRRVRVS